jgi:hypothetical protein
LKLKGYHQAVSSPEQVLPRPQRNDLFRALGKTGSPISEFRLEVDPRNSHALFIHHDSSQSYFLIGIAAHGFQILGGALENGDPAMRQFRSTERFWETLGTVASLLRIRMEHDLTWEEVVPLAEKWALAAVEGFREYEATPDLWTGFEHSRQLFVTPSDNTPFTEAEREQVCLQIQQIEVYITTTYELSADQVSDVNERLDQIKEASRRLDE